MTLQKLETRVVGMQYRTKQALRYMIAKKVPLKVRLERELDNEYDANAIKVIGDQSPYKDIFLGYIPRVVAEVMAPKMDNDKEHSKPLIQRAKLLHVDAIAGEGQLEIVLRRKIKLDG